MRLRNGPGVVLTCLLYHLAQYGSEILAASSLWAKAQRTASFLITGISHSVTVAAEGRALALHCVMQGMLAALGNRSFSPHFPFRLLLLAPSSSVIPTSCSLSPAAFLLILLTRSNWLHALLSPAHSSPNLELPYSVCLCLSLTDTWFGLKALNTADENGGYWNIYQYSPDPTFC